MAPDPKEKSKAIAKSNWVYLTVVARLVYQASFSYAIVKVNLKRLPVLLGEFVLDCQGLDDDMVPVHDDESRII